MAAVGQAALVNALRLTRLTRGPLAMERQALVHEPVMVGEVLEALNLPVGGTVVDGTLGLGGHAARMAAVVGEKGLLVGFDWDASMLSVAKDNLAGLKARTQFHNESFKAMEQVLGDVQADGILLDLGLNSAQVDDPSRGFSFQHDAPLDMRMDRQRGEPASALLNRMTPGEIEEMLRDYGDERFARAIARRIVERRREQPLRTTGDLNACVLAAIPPFKRDKRIHPSTRTFQAVRIQVNRELQDLEEALEAAARCLRPGGTLVVLSYHSGEDRATKRTFRSLAEEGYIELYRRPLEATDDEVRRNPRSRSARLRALRRGSEESGDHA